MRAGRSEVGTIEVSERDSPTTRPEVILMEQGGRGREGRGTVKATLANTWIGCIVILVFCFDSSVCPSVVSDIVWGPQLLCNSQHGSHISKLSLMLGLSCVSLGCEHAWVRRPVEYASVCISAFAAVRE